MKTEYGMDNERIYPHWDCPKCDAPNAGAEQCDPRLHVGRKKRVRCDECGEEMIYRGDYGDDADNGPYNFARITTVDGEFDHECPVSVAEALLDCGTLKSFDGIVRHGDAAEHLYTVTEKRVPLVANYFAVTAGGAQ
jgi:predicted RNA-binding Zn-ribbon protein involved in translation (DUF1610 family)